MCLSKHKSKHRPSDKKFSQQRMELDRISHRFEALRHIFKTFHEGYTIFLSGQPASLKLLPTPNGPWLEASADFCRPFPTGEMVVLDAYSKYPEAEFVPSTAALNSLPALE